MARDPVYKEMPRKHKKTKLSNGLSQKPLILSDRYLFRRTYLDASMIDQLANCTQEFTNNSSVLLTPAQTAFLAEAITKLRSFEFNNIYDYLEELINGIHGDRELVKAVTSRIEAYFGEECIRLTDLHSDSEYFDA